MTIDINTIIGNGRIVFTLFAIIIVFTVWFKKRREILKKCQSQLSGIDTIDTVIKEKYLAQHAQKSLEMQGKQVITKSLQEIADESGLCEIGYSHAPGVLTGTGILLTFLGIIFGLFTINLSDPDRMQTSVTNLISGMALAFSSSLAGVWASLRLTEYLHKWEVTLQQALDSSTEELSKRYEVETPQLYLRSQAQTSEAQQQTALLLGEAAEKLVNTMDQVAERLDADRMAELISVAISSTFESTLKPSLDSIDHKFEVLSDIAQATQELTEMNQQLKQYITHDLQAIFDRIIGAFNSAQGTISEVNKGLGETNQAIGETRNIIVQSNDNIRLVNNGLESMTEKMNTVLEKYEAQTIKLLHSVGDEVRTVLDSSNQKMQQTLNGVSDKLIGTSNSVQTELTKFREAYTESLDEYLDKQSDILDKSVGRHLEGLTNVTANLSEVFNQEYMKRKEQSEQIDNTINRITSIIATQKNIEQTIKDELLELTHEALNGHERVLNRLSNFSAEITKNVDTFMSKMDRELAAVFEYFDRTVDEFNSSAQILSESMGSHAS